MKVGIITHYNVHNHGAHLQLYALAKQLGELGYEAQALQFKKNYDFMDDNADAKYNISIKSVSIYIKYLIKNGLSQTLYNYKKRKVLAAFRNEQNLVGCYYSKANDLDAVVIGSDEIFSVEAGPNPWFYGIGVPCKNQISYAASFGPTNICMISEHNVEGLVQAGLVNLKHIAVRDGNSQNIVKKLTDREATLVCDPVLLYPFSDAINPTEFSKFRSELNEKYCIVYSYDYNMNEETTIASIRNYAKANGLRIYSLAYYHKWCDRNIQVAPLDVFKWFHHAEMVFTDTFHGSVISLATEAQFIAKLRGNANKLLFLLNQFGVSDRQTEDFADIEKHTAHPINYQEVTRIIKNIRQSSLEYLQNALSESEKV